MRSRFPSVSVVVAGALILPDGGRQKSVTTPPTVGVCGPYLRFYRTEPGGRSTPISSQIGGMMISDPRGLQNGVPGGSGSGAGAGAIGGGGAV